MSKEYAAAELVRTTDLPLEQVAAKVGLVDAAAVEKALRLPQIAGYLSKCLDDAGATLESTAVVVAEGQKAVKKTYGIYKGEIIDERSDPDHGTRLAAAELNLKARGELKGDRVQVNLFNGLADRDVAAIAAGQLDPAKLVDRGPRIDQEG
jgi:hypothetical protein